MTASGGPGVFRITGIADFRDILRRFRDVEDQAARTGTNVGTGLAKGSRDAFKELPASAKAASEAAGAALGPLRNALLSLTAGVSFAALFKGAIDEATKLETITRKLSNTLGEQGAASALSFTRGLSDDLGLSFNTLAGTFGSFTAAASAANVPLTVQQDLFAAVAKSAQSLGLSNDELGGSLLALQQVASKGTVQMEELRGQLGERLPIAFGATAKGLGITQQELIKLVESGKLTAAEFFPALTKGLNELTAGAGGAATAAQNFQSLSNAWIDLQASFGTNALPGIIAVVKSLTGALEGLGVQLAANKLGLGGGVLNNLLGQVPAQGAQAVGALKALQTQYKLTEQQARALFTNAVKDVGASTDAFGRLSLSSQQFANILDKLPGLARAFREANPDRKGDALAAAAAEGQVAASVAKTAEEQKKTLEIDRARVKAAAELNTLKAQEPVRALDSQIAVGGGVLGFAKAAASLEQERFNTVQARNQYEIENAQRLGLTQDQIAERQKANDELKKQALITQYQALVRSQAIEAALLQLSQRKAQVEAQIGVIKAQQAAAQAQAAVGTAKTPVETAQLQEAARLAQYQVGLAQQQLALLQATQPLEAASAQAAREAAVQQLRTQGAAQGIEQALVNITPAQQAVNDAYRQGVQLLTQFPGELNTISGVVGDTSQQAQTIVKAFTDASGAITVLSQTASKAGTDAGKLGDEVGKAKDSAKGFEAADLGKSTDDAAKNARTFASNMADAAGSAQKLLQYLSSAAGLSPSRFAGGDVEGGHRYRINDGPGGRTLGQEAFLSAAGRLSLIKAPANSLWTAPTAGTVIPAAMTRQLKDAGMFAPSASVMASHQAVAMQRRTGSSAATVARAPAGYRGGDPTMARLELAVSNLAGQVQALSQKQWTVPVNVRNSAGNTQLRVLNGLV